MASLIAFDFVQNQMNILLYNLIILKFDSKYCILLWFFYMYLFLIFNKDFFLISSFYVILQQFH